MQLGPGLSVSPDSLSVLSHALGWQSKPTLWMTSQPRNPLELRRGKLDSGKTQATIRLMRVWASSHRAGGWGMVIANMPWALRGCLPAVLFSSQHPHGHAYHQPYFTEGKTEVHGDKWLAPDHTVRKYSTRGQSQLDKDLPLCLRYRKMIGIILFHCIRNTI